MLYFEALYDHDKIFGPLAMSRDEAITWLDEHHAQAVTVALYADADYHDIVAWSGQMDSSVGHHVREWTFV